MKKLRSVYGGQTISLIPRRLRRVRGGDDAPQSSHARPLTGIGMASSDGIGGQMRPRTGIDW